ncbi:TULIP family P47-like protein [Bacillus thuringiensis]|nr:TULIP family P47-like protein [Bacillus thuringiensis]
MKKKQLDSLRIYDWVQTTKDVKNQDSKLLRNFSTVFHQEMKDPSMDAKVTGNWGSWELTDEGSGRYPIFKCYIENGTFEVDINHKKTTYDLQHTWIKICLKIEDMQKETYVISEKEDTLYSINHSFLLDQENSMLSSVANHLFVTWLKEHRELLQQQLNTYTIHSRTSDDLSLLGWDTNYVTSFSNVNKTIQQQNLYPSTFEHELIVDDDFTSADLLAEGTFQPWEITTGADGQNVNFICKFGENSGMANKKNNKIYKFNSNAYAKIQLKLQYLDSSKTIEDPTGEGNGEQVNLMVKTDNDNNGDAPVILISLFLSEEIEKNISLKGFSETIFKEWFNENIEKFEQIFSSFLLNETAKDENFQWLKPTTVSYGVAEAKDENGEPSLDNSVFAVMTMVEKRENKNPTHGVDNRLLQAVKNAKDTNDSAFGIDMPLFVEKWLVQGLNIMQVGVPSQFEKTSNGLYIQNKERIPFGRIPNADGDEVDAHIDPKKFRMGITNNQLELDIDNITWKHTRGIIGHVSYRQYFDLKLKSGVDTLGAEYKNVLVPEEVEEAIMTCSYQLEDWYKREKLLVGIATELTLTLLTGYFFSKTSDVFRKAFKVISKTGIAIGKTMVKITVKLGQLLKKFGLKFWDEARNIVRQRTYSNLAVHPPTTNTISSPGQMKRIWSQPRQAWSIFKELEYKMLYIFPIMGIRGVIGTTPTIIWELVDAMNQKEYSKLPSTTKFLAQCVGAIKWPDNGEFQLETGKLQGFYLMGGRLNKK